MMDSYGGLILFAWIVGAPTIFALVSLLNARMDHPDSRQRN